MPKFKYSFFLFLLVLFSCSEGEEPESSNLEKDVAPIPPLFPYGIDLATAEMNFKQVNTGSSDCKHQITMYEFVAHKLIIDSSFCKDNSMKVNYFFLEKGKLMVQHSKEWTKEYGGDSEFSLTEHLSDFAQGHQWFLEQDVKKLGAPATIELKLLENSAEGQTQWEREVEVLDFGKDFSIHDTYELYSLNYGVNPATGTNNFGIYLSCKSRKDQIFLAEELAFVEAVDRKSKGIPDDAVFAFDSWFGGGGYAYYGVVSKGRLFVYRKYEDESSTPGSAETELVRKLDPHALTEIPAYYLVFNENKKREKSMLVAFGKDGKALFIEYEGGSRQYPLAFMKGEMKGNSLVLKYKCGGHRNFVHTHSGNWDYLELERVKDGKKLSYTVDLERSQGDQGYVVLPPF